MKGLKISEGVRSALTGGGAIVALESTVIAHGLPYPENARVAAGLEDIAREEGAVPATIGVVDGVPTVGLDADDIDWFASASDIGKASLRDLGPVIAAGGSAATTVAATSVLAARAGIRVFATGGIGGVHRGGEASLDVSADLFALGATPIAVVCAGAKAILDLPRTLEMLETLGVPVIGFGTDEFPAFYTRVSGLALEHRVEDATGVADTLSAHWGLGLTSSVIVCVPPPADREMDGGAVGDLIARAEREAREAGVRGKDLTPWLLAKLAELSDGETVATNVALLENNVRVAARTAAAFRR